MSKTKKRFDKRDRLQDNDDYVNGVADEVWDHRKQKRIEKAIKTKDIKTLEDLEDL